MDFAAGLAFLIVLAAVAAIGTGSFIEWMRDEWKRMRAKTWAPETHTKDDPAVKATLARLAQARVNMDTRGQKTLLTGHRGWQTVNPMAKTDEPTKVIRLKRGPR